MGGFLRSWALAAVYIVPFVVLGLCFVALPRQGFSQTVITQDFEDAAIGESNPGDFVAQPASGTAGISTYAVMENPLDNTDQEYELYAERVDANNNAAASINFGGLLNGPNDWIMQTDARFVSSTGSTQSSFGLAGFSIGPDLDVSRILADMRISDGRIRLLGMPHFANTDAGPVSEGDLFRFTWETDFDVPGDLVSMTLTVDNLTQQTQGVVTAEDSLSDFMANGYAAGEYFGYRQRALNIPGALTVAYDNFRIEVFEDSAGLEGDFNGDDVVNLADYSVWRDNLGNSDESVLSNNGNGLDGVDAADYALWKTNFGQSQASPSTSAAQAIPEPASAGLLVLLLSAAGAATRNRT